MNLLLDTHALLWWLDDNRELSHDARSAIADSENLIFVSAVVIWEIRIKQGLGKLTLPVNFREVLASQSFEKLDVTIEHAHKLAELPPHHRDPFDRMLVAQALVENLTIISRDEHIPRYSVQVIFA